ncbi:HNH endonuclease signature motif containing protein [Paenibacillus lautus]|uniref:HNH endonuclease signature motif containing protein n=1 Tax=Paenibacillus lautus TaxID=1401 RepID=UPI003558CC0F
MCSEPVLSTNVHIHHINPSLPITLVNRVTNLATVHFGCHKTVHSSMSFEHLGNKVSYLYQGYRQENADLQL